MAEDRKISISAIDKYKDEYVCFARDINVLFSLNIENGSTKGLCFLPEKRKERLIEKIIIWKDCVVMIPLHAEKVYMYDMKKEKLEFIDLPQGSDVPYFKFFNGFLIDDNIFLIGSYYPAIVKINLMSKTVKEVPVYKERLELRGRINDCFTRKSIVRIDNKVYISSAISNEVLIYDYELDDYIWKNVGRDDNSYSGIAWDGEAFWLAPRRNSLLVRWVPEKAVEEIDISLWYKEDNNFASIECRDGNVFLYSLQAHNSFVYDYRRKKGSSLYTGAECFFEHINEELIYQLSDGIIHIITENGIDDIKAELTGIYDLISKSDDKWDYFFNENETFDLALFIDEVCKN